VPGDTGEAEGGSISLAVGSKGQGALAVEELSGTGEAQCFPPKVARTNDFVSWTSTCTVSGANQNIPEMDIAWPRVAFDPADRLYVAFQNRNPTNEPAGLILWYQPAGNAGPQISSGGIVNAASFTAPIAPGSLATIFGTNFLSGNAIGASATPLPPTLGNVSVSVNGRAAPLLYVGGNQINFQVPYETPTGTANVVVTANNAASNTAQVNVVAAAPGIFVYGSNDAVIQNSDYSINGSGSPAKPGSYVIIYATGGGQVGPAVATGAAAAGSPLSNNALPVSVSIGGKPAAVAFAGMAPGFVGLLQINAQVPSLPDGSYPVQVSINGQSSNAPVMFVSAGGAS